MGKVLKEMNDKEIAAAETIIKYIKPDHGDMVRLVVDGYMYEIRVTKGKEYHSPFELFMKKNHPEVIFNESQSVFLKYALKNKDTQGFIGGHGSGKTFVMDLIREFYCETIKEVSDGA